MKNRAGHMRGLRAFVIIFVAALLALAVAFSILMVLIAPLVRWALHGVLYFPAGSEILGLMWYVLAMAALATVGIWLEGKLHGRW